MGLSVPLIGTSRARDKLSWRPQQSRLAAVLGPHANLGQARLGVRCRVAADHLPVLEVHRADRRQAMGAALTCTPRCSGDETEQDGDRERNRERDQRGASSVFHVPQQQTPQSQRQNPPLGCVLGRSRRAERPKETLRSLDRVSSRAQFAG